MPRYVFLHHQGHPSKDDHFDLMLERGGVLRTWAKADPGFKSGSAVQNFDHRLLYLEYEGAISGDRGSVRRVASGTFQVMRWDDDHIRIRLEDGELVLATEGKPSQGAEWRLRWIPDAPQGEIDED